MIGNMVWFGAPLMGSGAPKKHVRGQSNAKLLQPCSSHVKLGPSYYCCLPNLIVPIKNIKIGTQEVKDLRERNIDQPPSNANTTLT